MLFTRKLSLAVSVVLYGVSSMYAEHAPSTVSSVAPTQTEHTEPVSTDNINQQSSSHEQQKNEQQSWCSCVKDITLKKILFVVGGCGFAAYACKQLYDLVCAPTRHATSTRPNVPTYAPVADEQQEDPAIVIEALSDEQRHLLHAFAAALEAADIEGLYAFNFDDFPFEWRLALAWTQMRVIALYESGIDAATLAVHRQHLVEGLREMIQVFDGLAQEKEELAIDVEGVPASNDTALEVASEEQVVVHAELTTEVEA